LNTNNYIVSHCGISQNLVYQNGKKIFGHADQDPQNFLHALYAYLQLDYVKFFKMDALCKLGFLAAEILLAGQQAAKKAGAGAMGVVLANASSSLDTDIKYLDSAKDFASPAQFVYTLPSIVIGEICIRHGIKGENAFFVFEDFDAGFTWQYVSDLLDRNIVQFCICGWVELLGDQYKAKLFLAGKRPRTDTILFTKETMDNLFKDQSL
jgi:hypothetical protein